MKGVRVAAHHANKRSDSRKLVSMTRSASVAVVDEMAPRRTTASSLRPSSQRKRSAGGTNSASCPRARLRHLPSLPRISFTAMSARPASLRLATTFDPMKPAPPVTNNIDAARPVKVISALLRLPAPLPQSGAPSNSEVVLIEMNYISYLKSKGAGLILPQDVNRGYSALWLLRTLSPALAHAENLSLYPDVQRSRED